MIKAQAINLLDAPGAPVPLARGVVPIDTAEGPPAVITWDGATFVIGGWRADGSLDYRKARVLHAGAGFEAVR